MKLFGYIIGTNRQPGTESDRAEPSHRKPGRSRFETLAKYQVLAALSRHERAKDQNEKADQHVNERAMLRSTVAVARFNGVLAVVGIVSAVIAALQWNAIKNADGTTRESFQLVQRAFVVVSTLSAKYDREADKSLKSIRYSPVITNSGGTPTKNLKIIAINPYNDAWRTKYSNLSTSPPPPEDLATGEDIMPIYFPLGPKSDLPDFDTGFPIDGMAYGMMLTRQLGWYYYGIITYNDIFDEKKVHITKYCFSVNSFIVRGGGADGAGFKMYNPVRSDDVTPNVRICSHWNCVDEECQQDRRNYESDVKKADVERLAHEDIMRRAKQGFLPLAPPRAPHPLTVAPPLMTPIK